MNTALAALHAACVHTHTHEHTQTHSHLRVRCAIGVVVYNTFKTLYLFTEKIARSHTPTSTRVYTSACKRNDGTKREINVCVHELARAHAATTAAATKQAVRASAILNENYTTCVGTAPACCLSRSYVCVCAHKRRPRALLFACEDLESSLKKIFYGASTHTHITTQDRVCERVYKYVYVCIFTCV